MRGNQLVKEKDERVPVTTIDNSTEPRRPPLTEYLNSVISWLKGSSGSSSPTREAAPTVTCSKGVQKSISGSALTMRSISNNILRRYTHSKTLSIEDLKRMFMKKSSSFEKVKRRRSRIKVKNREKRNKWDKDVQVLYSCNINKFPREIPQRRPVNSSENTTHSLETAADRSILLSTWNYEKKQSKQSHQNRCDYRSYCRSIRVGPFYLKRLERDSKSSQYRDAKVIVDRACSAISACMCCPCPAKQATRRTYHNTHTSKKHPYQMRQPARPETRVKNPQNFKQTATCWPLKIMETDPESDYPHMLHHQRKKVGQTTVYNNAKSSNKMHKYSYSKPNASDPKSNCSCCKCRHCTTRKEDSVQTNELIFPPNEYYKLREWQTQYETDLITDHSVTQTSSPMCAEPSRKAFANKHTSDNMFSCPMQEVQEGSKNVCQSTQLTESVLNTSFCSPLQEGNFKTVLCTSLYLPPQEAGRQTVHATTQMSNPCCQALSQKDVVDNQSSNSMFLSCLPKRIHGGSKIGSTSTQLLKNMCCLSSFSPTKKTDLKNDYAITQTSCPITLLEPFRKNVVDNQTSYNNMFSVAFPSFNSICAKKKSKRNRVFGKKSSVKKMHHNKTQTYFKHFQRRNLKKLNRKVKLQKRKPSKCCRKDAGTIASLQNVKTIDTQPRRSRLVQAPSGTRYCCHVQTLPELRDGSCQVDPGPQKLTRDIALCTEPVTERQPLLRETLHENTDFGVQTSKAKLPEEYVFLPKISNNQNISNARDSLIKARQTHTKRKKVKQVVLINCDGEMDEDHLHACVCCSNLNRESSRNMTLSRLDKACSPRKSRDLKNCQDIWCNAGIYECYNCKNKKYTRGERKVRNPLHRTLIVIRKCLQYPGPSKSSIQDGCDWPGSTPMYLHHGGQQDRRMCCNCFFLGMTAALWVPVVFLMSCIYNICCNTCNC